MAREAQGHRRLPEVLLRSQYRGLGTSQLEGCGVTSVRTGSCLQPHCHSSWRHTWKITACFSEGPLGTVPHGIPPASPPAGWVRWAGLEEKCRAAAHGFFCCPHTPKSSTRNWLITTCFLVPKHGNPRALLPLTEW